MGGNVKTYPAENVTPIRSNIVGELRSLNVGMAMNIPIEKRKNYLVAISRLKRKEKMNFRTTKISEQEVAIIRE